MIILDKEEALKQIDERTDVFKKAMRKADIDGLVAKVVFAEDISGSMRTLYNRGIMQGLTEMIFPVALNLDDDGEMEMFAFDTGVTQLDSLNKDNFYGYVKENINHLVGGGTNYAPVINKIVSSYTETKGFLFKKRASSKIPTFVIFQTDGDNYDKADTDEALANAAKYNIFFKFVGTGTDDMAYLDTIKKKKFSNCDVIKIRDIENVSADELYDKLLVGFKEFLNSL